MTGFATSTTSDDRGDVSDPITFLQERVANLRDLGGLWTTDNRQLNRDRLIRSSTFAFLSSEAWHRVVRDFPRATYVDLRTEKEDARDGGLSECEALGWELIRFPLDEHALKPTALATLYDRITERILARERFDGPIVIACSLGKDRTGQVVARLLHALGVPKPTISVDFLASNTQLLEQAHILPERFQPSNNGYEDVVAAALKFDWERPEATPAAKDFFLSQPHASNAGQRQGSVW